MTNEHKSPDKTEKLGPDLTKDLGRQLLDLDSRELIAQPHGDLVAKYCAFRDAVHPKADVVYHPCGAVDISPSVAFPHSRVIYAEWSGNEDDDLPQRNVAALTAAGVEVHFVDANTFDPGPVDVVILLNPTIGSEGPVSHLKEGGYCLANNYHGNADELHDRSDDFELVGIIHDRTPSNKTILDTESPEEYWQKVETDEEFRQSPGFTSIGLMSEKVTGTTNPSLQQYLEAIKKVKVENPDALELDGFLMYGSPMRLFPCALPNKRGNTDDFFVFRRLQKP